LPARFWKKPVAHILHFIDCLLPSSLENLPGEQSLQPLLFATPFAEEYFPAIQSLQELEAVNDLSSPYLPLAQSLASLFSVEN
jgi:hypothetical protein